MLIPPQSPPTPSPRTRALADRLRATIADFQRREPTVTPEEVAHALREVQPDAPRSARRPLAVIGAVLVAAGAAVVAGVLSREGTAGAEGRPAALIVWVAVAAVLTLVALVMRVRR